MLQSVDKGKLISTLAKSPLIYLSNVININVSLHVIDEVKQVIVDFLWDGQHP